jgi:hypothetical protein
MAGFDLMAARRGAFENNAAMEEAAWTPFFW